MVYIIIKESGKYDNLNIDIIAYYDNFQKASYEVQLLEYKLNKLNQLHFVQYKTCINSSYYIKYIEEGSLAQSIIDDYDLELALKDIDNEFDPKINHAKKLYDKSILEKELQDKNNYNNYIDSLYNIIIDFIELWNKNDDNYKKNNINKLKDIIPIIHKYLSHYPNNNFIMNWYRDNITDELKLTSYKKI